MVRKYLLVLVFFVLLECVFSLCGNFVNKKRCRLIFNNVDLFVFFNRKY